jgi:hypothetical protein
MNLFLANMRTTGTSMTKVPIGYGDGDKDYHSRGYEMGMNIFSNCGYVDEDYSIILIPYQLSSLNTRLLTHTCHNNLSFKCESIHSFEFFLKWIFFNLYKVASTPLTSPHQQDTSSDLQCQVDLRYKKSSF